MLYKINQKEIIKKNMHTKFGHMMTKLRSGQGKRDDADTDADADADAADQSNAYMSPFQATQKYWYTVYIFKWIKAKHFFQTLFKK